MQVNKVQSDQEQQNSARVIFTSRVGFEEYFILPIIVSFIVWLLYVKVDDFLVFVLLSVLVILTAFLFYLTELKTYIFSVYRIAIVSMILSNRKHIDYDQVISITLYSKGDIRFSRLLLILKFNDNNQIKGRKFKVSDSKELINLLSFLKVKKGIHVIIDSDKKSHKNLNFD